MNISQIFSIVLLAIVCLIMLFSVLRGLARGWKKSLLAFGWLVGIFILLLIFSGLITKGVTNISLSFLGLEIEGVKINSLSDINTVLTSSLEMENSSVLGELVASIPLMLMNVVLFTVMFWVLRLITWPIYAIVCAIVFRKDRKAKKEWKKAGKPDKPIVNGAVAPQKPKVKRWYGALIGVASGLLICFVTLIPLMGVNNYVQTIKNIQISSVLASKITDEANLDSAVIKDTNVLYAENSDKKVALINLFLDEEVSSYLNIYEDSIVGKTFKVVGLNFLGTVTFDGLTKARVAGETISLKNELNNILDLYYKAEVLLVDYDLLNATEDTLKNFTQEDWSEIITTSRAILGKAFDSKIVSVVLNNYFGDVVKYVAEEHLNEKIENDVENEVLKEVCFTGIDYLVSVGDNHEASKFLYSEIDKLLQICETINNYNLLNPLINNNYNMVLNDDSKNDIIKDFKAFVDYMDSKDSVHYKKGEYISSLAQALSKKLTSCSILNEFLPKAEEAAVRSCYEIIDPTNYNSYYPEGYDNSYSVNRFKEMNSQLFTNIFNIVLNAGYHYEDINSAKTILEGSGEEKLEDFIKVLNSNGYLKQLIIDVGGLADTVFDSDAIMDDVEKAFVNKGLNKVTTAIKDAYNYDSLEEDDANKKLCTSLVSIVEKAAGQIQGGDCAELMRTITDSFIKAFDTIQTLSNIKEIENIDEINITEIADIVQDLTSGNDSLIENKDIANILDTAFDAILNDSTDSILDDEIEITNEDGSKSTATVSEILVNNIANNTDLNWSKEGAIIDNIAKKAIEITNDTNGTNLETLVGETKKILNDLTSTDAGGNTVSSSNILTPELISYFNNYLDGLLKTE